MGILNRREGPSREDYEKAERDAESAKKVLQFRHKVLSGPYDPLIEEKIDKQTGGDRSRLLIEGPLLFAEPMEFLEANLKSARRKLNIVATKQESDARKLNEQYDRLSRMALKAMQELQQFERDKLGMHVADQKDEKEAT